MQNWDFWFNQTLWLNIAIVMAISLALFVILRTLVSRLSTHVAAWAEKQHELRYKLVAEIFRQTSRFLLLALSVLMALKLVDLPAQWESTLSHGWFVALALQIALWLEIGIRLWAATPVVHADGTTRNPVTTTIIAIMLRLLVWSVMLLSILANLGVDITALVASLGVGGIAVALAVQTLLSDLFASLSIGVDKPFEIGDFVVFGSIAGNIEHIGLKTTRIRSLSGEQIVCSNADLLRQTLHNYKRMETRRILFKFGVTYDTPTEKVREIGRLVERIIAAVPDTRFDRAHFQAFGEYQLTFEVVYFVLSSDYNKYMDIQQEINLGLLQGLRDLNVQFAFPTRSVEFIGGAFPELQVAGIPQTTSSNAERRAASTESS
ncbi:MAG TPA: mechanosensitive ion channel family protein [Pseudomonas sp.]|uniref:mechanosensitive ion channel family protein n=1 Tax=Pseudomonas sp. TaxID=306 RepID=UPI002D0EB771|nr:mechanosensitive ion channel family protein [Pseudomonas sp.]HSX89543.1 mechanosensitive ion channel family protein [Pseudomonas sp.]